MMILCFFTQYFSDPIMAESLSEASGSLEVLEASDEGKKKSKFKGLKSFFGKKKKKGPEDAQGGRQLTPSLSSGSIHISTVESVQEGDPAGSSVTSIMGSKALSHDSIFMLDPEPEIKLFPSPEFPRGRSLQRSYVSRTLPRTRASGLHGAVSGIVFGTMLPYVPRSAIWAEESEITERSSPLARQRSISPPVTRSDTICKDFEEISVDEESPKFSPKEVIEETVTLKSSFEPSLEPVQSQSLTTFARIACPSSTQLPLGFSTPDSTRSCLDSSAARHKMALNPQKQKKNLTSGNALSPSLYRIFNCSPDQVKPTQEEPDLPLAPEAEKSTMQPKEASQKKPRKDIIGTSSLEQSKKTESLYKKTAEQAISPDAASAQGRLSLSVVYRKRRVRKGPSAAGTNECTLPGRSFKRSSAFSGDLSLEESTTPLTLSVTPQDVLVDKDGLGQRNPGIDFKAGKASVAQSGPEDVGGDPSPCREDGASRAKKPEARATLSSAATSAKPCEHPSHTESERKEASSSELQGRRLKTESVQDIPTVGREKPASALAERGISVDRPSHGSLSWAAREPAEEASSSSESSLEVGGGSEQQVAPRLSFQSLQRPKDGQKVFTSPGSAAADSSQPGQQLASRSPSLALAQPEAEEESLDSESAPEDMDACQAAGKPDGGAGLATDSKSTSAEDEASTALGRPKDKGSTGRHGAADKFKSADPSQASREKPKDQRESLSVSKDAFMEWGISMQPPLSFWKPAVKKRVFSDPLGALAQPSQASANAGAEQQASWTERTETTGQEWGLSGELLPPRTPLKRVLQLNVEQPVSKSPDIAMATGINSEAPECHSKSPPKAIVVDAVPVGPECVAVQDSIPKQALPSSGPFQVLLRPVVEDPVSCGAESVVVEKNTSMQPLVPKHQSLRQPVVQDSASPESAEAEGGPLLPKHAAQSLVRLQSQQMSENAAVKEGKYVKPLSRGPSQPSGGPKPQAQTLTRDSVSASAGSGPEEKTPPPHNSQAWMSPKVEQEAGAVPESTGAEWGIAVQPLPSRKSSWFRKRPGSKQQATSGSGSAPAAQSTPGEPKPPKSALQARGHHTLKQAASRDPEGAEAEKGMDESPTTMSSQSPMKPVVKQAVSAGPESVAAKRETSEKALPCRHLARLRVGHRFEQISSKFESVTAESTVSEKPLLFSGHTRVVVRSKVQEMSSPRENKALEGDLSKKSPMPRYPSKSFVKYMVEQVFSESPAAEGGVLVDPAATKPPSKPSVRPKFQFQVSSGQESTSMEGGPLQFSGRPKDPKEVSSQSESTPMKLSGSKEQPPPRSLSQALGKLEYQQDGSPVSESVREDRKSSKDKPPSEGPSQAHAFSTGWESVPMERSCSKKPLPPRPACWALADPETQRQVHSGSMGSAVEGAISGSNPSGLSILKGPESPCRTKKHSRSSEDLFKSTLAVSAKPVKFTYTPASQASTSRVTYPKEEVVKSSNPDNRHSDVSTTKADIENVFGIRLRKVPTSEKFKGEKQDDSTKLSSLSPDPKSLPVRKELRIRRSASHGFLGTAEYYILEYDCAEKQQGSPKSEINAGNQPSDKVAGKAPGQQAYPSVSEPTWRTKLTEKQKGSWVPVLTKEWRAKNRATVKEASHAGDTFKDGEQGKQPASIITSSVNKQEAMAPKKLPEPAKGGSEDEKPCQQLAGGSRIRRSSTLPALFQEPTQSEEPVWFSIAKRKAQVWSHLAEIIQ
ncbi:acrosomal protein KIAA1210 homolog [Suricata suricatta]|uniref:acrosomal protein KIAA1210 homolog n=1 Tax=Suricata suricatta TaxID=37032 RepID=UPI0011552CB1|nr:acrosomal protein KIAA1210 homolog [Suricata suricatta]